MGHLTGKRVAVVANGPSGTDQGAEIDACDFVVRQNSWITEGPKNAGRKASALCGYFGGTFKVNDSPGLEIPEWLASDRSWELWCHISAPNYRPRPNDRDVGDWEWVLRTADGRAIRLLRDQSTVGMIGRLKAMNPHVISASLGLACLAMAVELEPSELHLWGYDATAFGLPSYDWGQRQCLEPCKCHDFVAEKRLIAELVDRRFWLEHPVNFPTIWHSRPELPPA